MLGAICFVPALTSMDFGLATVQTFRGLQRLPSVRGVSVNARVELNPKVLTAELCGGYMYLYYIPTTPPRQPSSTQDPDAVWGYWWKPRQPRQPRKRWGWGRSPTPSPPPPPPPINNNPPPSSGNGGGNNDNSSPEPVPSGPHPDPSVYNWAVDRTNQQDVPLDKNNGQCPSRGSGVTVFILDTGCRTTHQVGSLVGWCIVCIGGVCVGGGGERRVAGPMGLKP